MSLSFGIFIDNGEGWNRSFILLFFKQNYLSGKPEKFHWKNFDGLKLKFIFAIEILILPYVVKHCCLQYVSKSVEEHIKLKNTQKN